MSWGKAPLGGGRHTWGLHWVKPAVVTSMEQVLPKGSGAGHKPPLSCCPQHPGGCFWLTTGTCSCSPPSLGICPPSVVLGSRLCPHPWVWGAEVWLMLGASCRDGIGKIPLRGGGQTAATAASLGGHR